MVSLCAISRIRVRARLERLNLVGVGLNGEATRRRNGRTLYLLFGFTNRLKQRSGVFI
jgi:hypothetical protein